jgi:hypothetical protein
VEQDEGRGGGEGHGEEEYVEATEG